MREALAEEPPIEEPPTDDDHSTTSADLAGDVNDDMLPTPSQSQELTGDQRNVTFLKLLMARMGGVGSTDVIVDDGSHVPSHQRLTLQTLWPALAAHLSHPVAAEAAAAVEASGAKAAEVEASRAQTAEATGGAGFPGRARRPAGGRRRRPRRGGEPASGNHQQQQHEPAGSERASGA